MKKILTFFKQPLVIIISIGLISWLYFNPTGPYLITDQIKLTPNVIIELPLAIPLWLNRIWIILFILIYYGIYNLTNFQLTSAFHYGIGTGIGFGLICLTIIICDLNSYNSPFKTEQIIYWGLAALVGTNLVIGLFQSLSYGLIGMWGANQIISLIVGIVFGLAGWLFINLIIISLSVGLIVYDNIGDDKPQSDNR